MLVAVTMNQMSSITTTVGSAKLSQSRMNEMCFDAGVMPSSSSSHGETARPPKTSATTVWPIILALLRRPRLRCRAILM